MRLDLGVRGTEMPVGVGQRVTLKMGDTVTVLGGLSTVVGGRVIVRVSTTVEAGWVIVLVPCFSVMRIVDWGRVLVVVTTTVVPSRVFVTPGRVKVMVLGWPGTVTVCPGSVCVMFWPGAVTVCVWPGAVTV